MSLESKTLKVCSCNRTIALEADALGRYVGDVASVGLPMLMLQDLAWSGYGIPVETIRVLFEEV